VNRAVWRATLGTLRANGQLAYYYLLVVFYTAQTCGIALRRPGLAPILLLAFWFGIGWPLFLRKVPTHRDLLRLPLSTRDAGSVLFLLRVIAPCLCSILVIPLAGQLFVQVPDAQVKLLELAFGLCAALPLMALVPFLPMPRSWREVGVKREDGDDPRLHGLAAAALWVLAPAIAALPLVSMRSGFTAWPWISLALGMGLAGLVWTQRERLAHAATATPCAPNSMDEEGARWHGGMGFIPLWSPLVGTCCALGVAIGLFFTLPLLPAVVDVMMITLVASSASLSARSLLSCARVLRLLPISPTRLAVIMLSMLVLPTLAGCLLGATIAHALHPERLSILHVELACLVSLTCNIVVLIPALRWARLKSIGPLLMTSVAPQAGLVFAALHFGIPAPPDAWTLAACLAVLGAGLAWLTARLKFQRLGAAAALAILALVGLPVFGATLGHLTFGDREPSDSAAASAAPHPGTEDALRRVIAELAAGKVNFDRIGPDLAALLRPQVGASQALLAQCGALQSVIFSGSSEHGWDIYLVRFQNATLEWRIVLGEDGKITGLRFSPH